MPALLFLVFLAMPLLELWVILQVGAVVGGWWTVALLLADSIAGAFIVRREGRRAWTAFRDALSAGRWPADEVAQGALVLVGGALLLTPGFVTDVIGLAFVLPPTRALLARIIRSRVRQGAIHVIGFGGPQGPDGPQYPGGRGPRGPAVDGAGPGGAGRGAGPGSRSTPGAGSMMFSCTRSSLKSKEIFGSTWKVSIIFEIRFSRFSERSSFEKLWD